MAANNYNVILVERKRKEKNPLQPALVEPLHEEFSSLNHILRRIPMTCLNDEHLQGHYGGLRVLLFSARRMNENTFSLSR